MHIYKMHYIFSYLHGHDDILGGNCLSPMFTGYIVGGTGRVQDKDATGPYEGGWSVFIDGGRSGKRLFEDATNARDGRFEIEESGGGGGATAVFHRGYNRVFGFLGRFLGRRRFIGYFEARSSLGNGLGGHDRGGSRRLFHGGGSARNDLSERWKTRVEKYQTVRWQELIF